MQTQKECCKATLGKACLGRTLGKACCKCQCHKSSISHLVHSFEQQKKKINACRYYYLQLVNDYRQTIHHLIMSNNMLVRRGLDPIIIHEQLMPASVDDITKEELNTLYNDVTRVLNELKERMDNNTCINEKIAYGSLYRFFIDLDAFINHHYIC